MVIYYCWNEFFFLHEKGVSLETFSTVPNILKDYVLCKPIERLEIHGSNGSVDIFVVSQGSVKKKIACF